MISVDTKKKELVGEFKNVGRELGAFGQAGPGQHARFPQPGGGQGDPLRRLRPRPATRGGSASAISRDTAQFAVASIQAWWEQPRPQALPERQHADDHRGLRRLQQLPRPAVEDRAAEARRPHRPARSGVCHFPPGTSKWNKIEHRLFSFIIDQLARQATDQLRQTVIDLIAATTTTTGLKVYARLDPDTYPTKIKVTDDQMQYGPHRPASTSTRSGTTPSLHDTNYDATPKGDR